jgi:hypothetical protein
MPRLLRLTLAATLFGALVAAPRPAAAVTVDQIVALAHAGVTDAVILALIDRDRTILPIEPEQIPQLQKEGLSEPVILAMLKSGREEGDEAARADAASNAGMILQSLAAGPETIIVGHGPEVPNTAHAGGFYSGPAGGAYYVPPVYAPYRLRAAPHRNAASGVGVQKPLMCFAQTHTSSIPSPSFGTVVQCPAVMQHQAR